MAFKEINGNLISLAKEGNYDLIIQGCNCFCTMKAGFAKDVARNFVDAVRVDAKTIKGDITKLGNYTIGKYQHYNQPSFLIINCYTQYRADRTSMQLDYEALILCLRKINFNFSGKKIGVPLIGCGLAGGDWNIVKGILQTELVDMDVTVVHYE